MAAPTPHHPARAVSRGPRIRISFLAFFLLVAGVVRPAGISAQTTSAIPLATRVELDSEVLDQRRTIEIAVPEGYEEGDATYPVLYVLDGMQNLRHVAGSAEVLARTGQIPPLIVVGIESDNRMRDFTPSAVADVPYSGGAPAFLEFLRREVIPYVEAHYRTHPFRILEGHSLGGLFAAYTMMEQPDVFDAHVVMSPSLWWNGEEMTERAKSFFAAPQHPLSAFFGIGTEDGLGMRNELGRFVDVLEQDRPAGIQWAHREFEDEGHMSAPLLVNYFGLKFIFGEMALPETLRESYDDAGFRAHEARIVEKYGTGARQSNETYVTLGLKLMEEEDYAGAVTVFERNAEAYPIFPPNYAWLADAYEANGQLSEALDRYRQALRRSQAIHYGQEEAYSEQIERLESRVGGGR